MLPIAGGGGYLFGDIDSTPGSVIDCTMSQEPNNLCALASYLMEEMFPDPGTTSGAFCENERAGGKLKGL